MSRLDSTRTFLLAEVEALAPFEFVAVVPSGSPLHVVEIARGETGGLAVSVPGRPRIAPELPVSVRSALRDRGFVSSDASDPMQPWSRDAGDASGSVDLAQSVLSEVFGAKPDQPIDIIHGSHKPEHDAKVKLAAVRERVERLLTEVMKHPLEQDEDGDYLLPIGDVRVTVAPRALPGGPVVVRIFAVTNVSVVVTPELGLFLARLNFSLMFGRFALDTEHSAVWFDETLLGEEFTDEGLRFAVTVVASTADQWDDRLKQMFGGATYQEVLTQRANGETPPVKPGEGPGLYL